MNQQNDRAAILAPQMPLSILHIEDNPDDAELCQRVLRKAQLDPQTDVVSTPEETRERLRAGRYDIILSDYNLGTWTGMDAFTMVRTEGYEGPFVLVTGALGEQKAVECIQCGVADYILKDRMERLPHAVLRAVEYQGIRLEHKLMQRSLERSEAKFRTLMEEIPTAVFIEDGSHCRYANRAAKQITGYNLQELWSMHFWDLLAPDSKKTMLDDTIRSFSADEAARHYDVQIVTKQHQIKRLEVTMKPTCFDDGTATLITGVQLEQLGLARSASAA